MSTTSSANPHQLVIENDDLWAAILRRLCVRQLCLATAVCRAHHALQPALLSERDALFVTFGPCDRHLTRHMALTERLRGTDCPAGSTLPRRCDRWKSNGDASVWRVVPLWPGVHIDAPGVFFYDTTLKVFDRPGEQAQDGAAFLRQVLSLMPALGALSLDLGQPHRRQVDPEHETYLEMLEREGPHGPTPLALLPRGAPLVELRIKDAVGQEKLLLQALVSFRRTLLRLDASGLGDVVLPILLRVGLEQLQMLRVGEAMDSLARGSRRDDDDKFAERAEWPRRVRLQQLGEACPALTALDVGFASIDGGVQYDDLAALCSRAQQGFGKLNRAPGRFRQLDLSQVMTYRDFDRGIAILGRWAPALTSLAVYGLHLSDAALGVLGQNCRQLSTLHMVACSDHSAAGLDQLLRTAPLRKLDLSFGLAPLEPLRAWVAGHGPAAPLHMRLTIIDSYVAEERRLLLTAAEVRSLLDAATSQLVLYASYGAVTKDDADEAVAKAVGVTAPAVAQYDQHSFSTWMRAQQRFGLRILDSL